MTKDAYVTALSRSVIEIAMYIMSQKTAQLFLADLRQISTTFENFWHKDGKEDIIMCRSLIFHLT